MGSVLLLLGVSASDAVADLWRIVNRGPASAARLLGRLFVEACRRAVALMVWIGLTTSIATWRSPDAVSWASIWSALTVAMVPLLFSGCGVAPHIGPVVYLGLHGWTAIRIGTRLHAMAGLATVDSVLAVLVGAAGYWLCRGVASGSRRRTGGPGPAHLLGSAPCP